MQKVPIIVTNHYLNDCLNSLDGIQALIVDEAHQLKQALDLKERRKFSYPELKFFIGQVGLINQTVCSLTTVKVTVQCPYIYLRISS